MFIPVIYIFIKRNVYRITALKTSGIILFFVKRRLNNVYKSVL